MWRHPPGVVLWTVAAGHELSTKSIGMAVENLKKDVVLPQATGSSKSILKTSGRSILRDVLIPDKFLPFSFTNIQRFADHRCQDYRCCLVISTDDSRHWPTSPHIAVLPSSTFASFKDETDESLGKSRQCPSGYKSVRLQDRNMSVPRVVPRGIRHAHRAAIHASRAATGRRWGSSLSQRPGSDQ